MTAPRPIALARLTLWILSGVFWAILLAQQVDVARHRAYWLDEAFDLFHSCAPPVLDKLWRGADNQCSPAPLYYMAHSVLVRSLPALDDRMLVLLRLISLAAAGGTLAAVAAVLGLRLGWAWGSLAMAGLAGQGLFARYVTEQRPYMAWLLGLTATALLASLAGSTPDRARLRWCGVALAAAASATALVATAGGLQAGVACLVLLFALHFRPKAERPRWLIRLALALAGVSFGLCGYYARLSTCSGAGYGGHLALTWSNAATLGRPVLDLILPAHAGSGLGNAVFIVGALVPLLLWRSRSRWSAQERFAFTLAVTAVAEIGTALPIAWGVIRAHYFFLPRLFVFVVVCRAVLIAVGGWFLLRWLGRRLSPGARGLVSAAVHLCILGIMAVTLQMGEEARLEVRQAYGAETGLGRECQSLEGRFIPVYRTSDQDVAGIINRVARMTEQAAACGWRSGPATRYVLADDGPDGRLILHLADSVPAGTRPFMPCGALLALTPR